MKVTLEKKENNQVHLAVDVDTDRVKRALERAFQEVNLQVAIPGFRKGKAPRQLVEKRVGMEYIKGQALEKLIPEALEVAYKEQELEVIDRPSIDDYSFDEKDHKVSFKAVVPVRPEVSFKGGYAGLEAQAPAASVSDEAVSERLAQLQKGAAEWVVVDRAIEEGDRATIDFKGTLKGADEPFPGGTAEKFPAEVREGAFIPGFKEGLIGKKAGESGAFDVTFPAEYHAKELAGQEATFEVTVHEVKAQQLPELDDAFAAKQGDFNTLADFKAHLTKELMEDAEAEREELLRKQLLEQALELGEVEVPGVMVQRETQFLMNQYAQVMQAQGMDLRPLMAQENVNRWAASLQPEAEKRIRTSLVLGTIAKAEGITVSPEEVEEEVSSYAGQYGVDPSAVREQLIQSGSWNTLADEVLSNKILDFLLEKAKVTDGPVPERYQEKAPEPQAEAQLATGEAEAPSAEA